MRKRRITATLVVLQLALVGLLASQESGVSPLPESPDPTPGVEASGNSAHRAEDGQSIPPGWNLSLSLSTVGLMDTNLLSSVPALSDESGRYSGVLTLTKLTPQLGYTGLYAPTFTNYDRFDSLNSIRQTLFQEVRYDHSKRTTVDWRTSASRYPSWAGSPLAQSMFGQLLMQLTGIDSLGLVQNRTTIETDIQLDHKTSFRETWNVDCAGGLIRYRQASTNEVVVVLTEPDSTTWNSRVGLSYKHTMDDHESLGFSATSGYFRFSVPDSHMLDEYLQVHYSRRWTNRWNASLSAGPEFRRSQGVAATWHNGLVGSGEIAHRTQRSALRVEVSNWYSMAQEQGSLTSWMVRLSDEHAIGNRWFVSELFEYRIANTSQAFGSVASGQRNIVDTGISGGKHLTRNLNWFLNYGVSSASSILAGQGTVHRQQIITGLSFTVDRALPR